VNASLYQICGLRIASDFPLTGLETRPPDHLGSSDEIRIRRAPIHHHLAPAIATFRNGQYVGRYDGRELLIEIPDAGRFLVRSGKEILVDPAPSTDDDELSAWLLATAFTLLCHQRGITPLHASAIDLAVGCAVFAGDSGDGKSTLIAALAQRGFPVVCDDVCFLQPSPDGSVQVWPGLCRIRLWEDATAALGYESAGLNREAHGRKKYLLPVRPPNNPTQPRRLLRVYELQSTGGDAPGLTRLHGAAAVEVLIQNVFGRHGAEYMGYKPQAFSTCAAAADEVEVFRFSRPLGFEFFEKGINLLEDHLNNQS
jgi:hypothetical protein